jgi:molybdate transport system ATP-binding protein
MLLPQRLMIALFVRKNWTCHVTTGPRNLSVRTTLTGTVASIEPDDGPLAAVNIDLVGHGQLVALATRKAIDQLGLRDGDRVFALIKTVALDERTVAAMPS